MCGFYHRNYAWHSGNTEGHPLFEGVLNAWYNMLFVKRLLISNKRVENMADIGMLNYKLYQLLNCLIGNIILSNSSIPIRQP